ncbi:MAG: lyase family protein [Paracoccaceae bacterium]
MAASIFGSSYLGGLFDTGEVGRLFSDSAEIRALLLTEGALAKVQGALGVIPEISAKAIHRASLEIQLDPADLREATRQNGVVIPGLVAGFRGEMQAPEHAQYIHWGATSQDIIDTALMLRLRQVLGQNETTIKSILSKMVAIADRHSATPMVARTWGRHATPTTWGGVMAQWGNPLVDALNALEILRKTSLWVSLSGASGTGSALGPKAAETRAALAEALGLIDPMRSWHTDRSPILEIASWHVRVSAILAGLGKSLSALAVTEATEIQLGGAGSSSTMPQKQNPVGPAALIVLHAYASGGLSSLYATASQEHQRDGAAWMIEWAVLPQIILSVSSALETAQKTLETLEPNEGRMRSALTGGAGLAMAEALSFALAEQMSRPDAQAATKAIIAKLSEQGRTLKSVAQSEYPSLSDDVFDPLKHVGLAPQDAKNFVQRVRQLS